MKVLELPEQGEQSSPRTRLLGSHPPAAHAAFAHWSEHAGRKFRESLRNQLFLFPLPWGTLCMINYEFTYPVSLQDSSQGVRSKLMERS